MSAPNVSSMIASNRSDDGTLDNDPMSEKRTVVEIGGSMYANLTKASRLCVGFEKGDLIEVHTFSDGVWIEKADDDYGSGGDE